MHTPGPWALISATGYAGNYEITSAIDDEHHDNARLIAAAPEFLEALRDIDVLVEDFYDIEDCTLIAEIQAIARGAIAKALSPNDTRKA